MGELCEYCGNEYHPKALTKHLRSQHPEELDWECPTCGDKFSSGKGMKHHHARTHGESLLINECEWCGDEFHNQSRDQKYCSKECFKESKKVVIECEICGTEFKEVQWRVESRGRKLCSDECVSEWKSDYFEGHEVSEETRQKLREANLGREGYWKGKERSEETIRKIEESWENREPPTVNWQSRLVVDTNDIVDSSWERDFAFLLSHHNLNYENPRNTGRYFELGHRKYTPDFIVEYDFVVEIKGYLYDEDECVRTAEGFMDQYPNYTYIVVGTKLPSDSHLEWENRGRFPELIDV